jgi:hypothetical protein
MAESSNRQLSTQRTEDTTSPSTADVMAAIRETRVRLATRLTRTADHVHTLFSAPSSAAAETHDGDAIGRAAKAIAVVGRTRRAWDHAGRTGVLRRAAFGAMALAIAAVLVAKRRSRS